ncbi:slipin family protein [Wenyingzhuangia sp. IMCC45574]
MREINIKKGKIGIVYNRKNEFKTVLTQNDYWTELFNKVYVKSVEDEFVTLITDTELYQNEQLVELLNIVKVLSNELVLVYRDGILSNILKKGVYKYWKANQVLTFKKYDISNTEELSTNKELDFADMTLRQYIREFEVFSYEKAILLMNDQFVEVLDAGIYRYWKNNTTIKISKVDIRQKQVELSGQELLTKDKATIRINLTAFYKVIDIIKAVIDNQSYENQIYSLLQLSLRTYVAKYTLDELLESKEELAVAILNEISEKAAALGVEISDVGIKDVILPGEMRTIMNQVLEAQKRSQANVITRREETAAIRSMLNTAKLMEENTMLLKMKEMEYVEKIADKVGEISINGNGNLVKQLKEILT